MIGIDSGLALVRSLRVSKGGAKTPPTTTPAKRGNGRDTDRLDA